MTQPEMLTPGLHAAGILAGKRGLVLGLANTGRSPGGSPRPPARRAPNSPSLTRANRLKKGCGRSAQELGAKVVGDCDVTDTAALNAVFKEIERIWESLDFVVHCVAFSDKDQLTGRYIDTTTENFSNTLLVSCYSFTAVAQRAEKLMRNGGAMLTLTYYGAEKWMPHYNVMGLAKAALESSVRYLAADLGEQQYQGQCDLGWPNQDIGVLRRRRFPLYS